MKLYAQMGYGPGSKIERAITERVIDGIIIGARDIKPANVRELANRAYEAGIDVMFDVQFYAARFVNSKTASLGHLPSYEYFPEKWARNRYEPEDGIIKTIKAIYEYQQNIPLTYRVSPNLIIDKFDQRETGIAVNFLRLGAKVAEDYNNQTPLLLTLGLSQRALTEKDELDTLLNEISIWKARPQGFYILIDTGYFSLKNVSNINEILLNLFYLIYSLRRNGYEVVVGYTDYLTPFVGSVGANAGATGWFENLKSFSLKRFSETPSGGRRPSPRYSSAPLLNRITLTELKAIEHSRIDVRSDTPFEEEFPGGNTNLETQILQHWAAIKTCMTGLQDKDIKTNIDKALTRLENAVRLYKEIGQAISFGLDEKSNGGNIRVILDSIKEFRNSMKPYL